MYPNMRGNEWYFDILGDDIIIAACCTDIQMLHGSVPGEFLGVYIESSVKIQAILNPTGGYMLTSSGLHTFIHLR